MSETNARALAILGASFLDIMLEDILVNFLVADDKEVTELLRYDQPLGSYSGRDQMAFCLGLLRKTVFHDLRIVGRVRNRFARDLYDSFEDEQIRSRCVALKWKRQTYMTFQEYATVRELFLVGVNQLVCHL